jgi:membrane protein
MGAAIAYYAVFSLAPLLILVIAVAAIVFGREAAQGAIIAQFNSLMGREGAGALQAMIESASKSGSGIAAVIGIGTLILAASGTFGEIQASLNVIWNAKSPKEEGFIAALVRRRLLSLTLVTVIGFLLLVSLVVSAALAASGDFLAQAFPVLTPILQVANFVATFSVITALFAMMFKLLPDVDIGWRDVWLGAVVTAALFTVAKYLVGFYIGSSEVTSSYGAAGALVIILLWIYYSAQVMLFGAEITRAYVELVHPTRASAT